MRSSLQNKRYWFIPLDLGMDGVWVLHNWQNGHMGMLPIGFGISLIVVYI